MLHRLVSTVAQEGQKPSRLASDDEGWMTILYIRTCARTSQEREETKTPSTTYNIDY